MDNNQNFQGNNQQQQQLIPKMMKQQTLNQMQESERKEKISVFDFFKSKKILIIIGLIIILCLVIFVNVRKRLIEDKKDGAKSIEECINLFNETVNERSVSKAKKISNIRYLYKLAEYDNYDELIEQGNYDDDQVFQPFLGMNEYDCFELMMYGSIDDKLNCTNINKILLNYDIVRDMEEEIKYESGLNLKIQEAYVVELTYSNVKGRTIDCYVYCVKINNRWFLEYGGLGSYKD